MKQFRLASALVLASMLALTGCADSEGASVQEPPQTSGTIGTSSTTAASATTAETSASSTSAATGAPQTSSEAAASEEASPPAEETVTELNGDVFSELGMTYPQLIEKYGERKGGWYNVHNFENGYGRYAFEYESMTSEEDWDSMGPCFMIDGVPHERLFLGITLPMSFEELEAAYGIECTSLGDEIGMDDGYWAEFTSEAHEGILIILATREKGIIDTNTSCVVRI